MRIALYHNLTSGGSKREAYELAKQLVSAGNTVHLFYPSTANEEFLPINRIAHEVYRFPIKEVGIYGSRFPGIRKYIDLAGLLINIKRIRALSKEISELINDKGYDFVFVHHDRTVQSPYLLRYLLTPSVYFCAEPMRQFYDAKPKRIYMEPTNNVEKLQRIWYSPKNYIENGIIKSEDRKNIRFADLLMTNSYFSAESIYRAHELRARVVYLGVDIDKFKAQECVKGNYVLSVGAISPLKCFDFIIESLSCVPVKYRPTLIVVGNSASKAETYYLEQLADNFGVSLDIRVNVDEKELVKLYSQALVFVYAPVLEPFGLAPLEAMACNLPVVAVKEGGVRESVWDGHTGVLVERNPLQFADALLELLCDKSKRFYIGQQAREYISSFWTWEQAYKRFEKIIQEEILSESSKRLRNGA